MHGAGQSRHVVEIDSQQKHQAVWHTVRAPWRRPPVRDRDRNLPAEDGRHRADAQRTPRLPALLAGLREVRPAPGRRSRAPPALDTTGPRTSRGEHRRTPSAPAPLTERLRRFYAPLRPVNPAHTNAGYDSSRPRGARAARGKGIGEEANDGSRQRSGARAAAIRSPGVLAPGGRGYRRAGAGCRRGAALLPGGERRESASRAHVWANQLAQVTRNRVARRGLATGDACASVPMGQDSPGLAPSPGCATAAYRTCRRTRSR